MSFFKDEKSDGYHVERGDDLAPALHGTIGGQLQRFINLRVKLDKKTGFLYLNKKTLKTPQKRITFYGLFVSDEDTFVIRPHVFRSKKAMTPRAWRGWLEGSYGDILRKSILPGMSIRTDNKFWRLSHVIGISPGAPIRFADSATHRKRHKTKSSRR